MMAADSDGPVVTTVVTCEGNLTDPFFPQQLNRVVGDLERLVGGELIVRKLEPWNSVRVTLSIPHEAAARLRLLASEGSQQLRALGILSVQVEGDQVISLRLAGPEHQEIVLRTTQDASSGGETSSMAASTSKVEAVATTSNRNHSVDEKVQFRSPNVVCPPDSVVPKVGTSTTTTPPARTYTAPFPFASMNQAIHGRDAAVAAAAAASFTTPPPPYPGKHPPITISSPLLVNLLQNDAVSLKSTADMSGTTVGVGFQNVDAHATAKKTIPGVTRPPLTTPVVTNSSVDCITLNNVQKRASFQPTSLASPHTPTNSLLEMAATANSNSTETTTIPDCFDHRSSDSLLQLTDLTPSLTELKGELDHLLPSIEQELAGSPPDIPEELTDPKPNHRNYLVNPLTGEMELHVISESETDEPSDVFTGLPSPVDLSDDDTNSTFRPDTTDQSDSEGRSNHSDSSKSSRLKGTGKSRTERADALKSTEKIKLRLKLEKSEPVSSAYKVDVSFINIPTKKANAIVGEELRVPPLHISLRGRNHVVINNKKRVRVDGDVTGSKLKSRKTPDFIKVKKNGATEETTDVKKCPGSPASSSPLADPSKHNEVRKMKKMKTTNHEYFPGGRLMERTLARHMYNSKEKLKGRRGSDSDVAHSTNKCTTDEGVEKKRRLSHADVEPELTVLGSTNTGTVTGLPSQKPRKDKVKLKETCKGGKEVNRKNYTRNLSQVILPTGEIDMEAKFKQRLMENTEEFTRHPPKPDNVDNSKSTTETSSVSSEVEKPSDGKSSSDLSEKQASRSPTSGGQGEDSGIESMDALSEKSPNQASQSPHADLPELKAKQVPELLDIEAQLAKMEGLNGEDGPHNGAAKLEQCCVLTSALQDSLKQGTVSITASHATPTTLKEQLPQVEVSIVPIKTTEGGSEPEPLPLRVTPPLYTYSNTEKTHGSSSPSPALSDSDSNSCSNLLLKNKSLLEQLLIEIPDSQTPSSPSPITRQLRTRTCASKLSSPELGSPALPKAAPISTPKSSNTTALTKRKRHESDTAAGATAHAYEDVRNKKPRKCSENAAELIKVCMGLEPSKVTTTNAVNKKIGKTEDSSDSDEPLIEIAGKVRKTISVTPKSKFKATPLINNMKIGTVNTRRSVRTTPALNTRSKGEKLQPSVDVLRRKTRNSEGEGKRRKDVK